MRRLDHFATVSVIWGKSDFQILGSTMAITASMLTASIRTSLDDARVSRTLFQIEVSKPNPAPVTLRVHLKAFIYFFHEIFDFAKSKRFKNDPLIGANLMAIVQLIISNPAIQYLTEARDSMSHNPESIIMTQGGWGKVNPPERNTDGTFNLPTRWDHLPGIVRISKVFKRVRRHQKLTPWRH